MLVEATNLRPAGGTSQSVTPPVAPAPRAEGRRSAPRSEAAAPSGQKAIENPGQAKSSSRLTYDKELSRTFVEFVDKDSGEVVHSFPPEELVRHMDELIEKNRVSRSQGSTGLLVDQQA